jgi:Alginate export
MKNIFILLFFFFSRLYVHAQEMPTFKILRYDEDYTFLKNDSSRNNWYKQTKFKPLSKDKKTYISFGGEVRYQYFYFKNEAWGKAPDDNDGYILNRYLGHVDFHAGKYFRTFVQLQSSLNGGKTAAPAPIDENQLDLHQAFIDIVLPIKQQQNLTFRIGRQEMMYGIQRIVSVRDGPNNRQAFDAAKVMYGSKRFKIDAFFSHYVFSKQKIFDDGFNKNTKFWGAYTVINKIPALQNIDLYYLSLWKSTATFDDGFKKELRHSVGTRIWNKTNNWQYDFEGLYQWGKFGTGKISAYTISSNTTYTITSLKYKPQINLKTELISGDENYGDDKLNTFNPLFPRGAYFGYAAIIGPANLVDIHPSVTLSVTKKLDISVDYDAFWRYSSKDGIYGPAVNLIYTGKNSDKKFIGNQFSTFFIYNPNTNLYFRGEFTWFKAGDFLRDSGPGKDILFTGITTQLKF